MLNDDYNFMGEIFSFFEISFIFVENRKPHEGITHEQKSN